MYIVGIIIAFIIGNILGLVGGGGSILTVPLVHYLFGESMLVATSYSLFIVGVASGIGVLQRLGKEQVDFRKGTLFVIPSMITAFSIRLWIMPLFPLRFSMNNFEISRDLVISMLLISVMLYMGIKTIRNEERPVSKRTGSIGNIIFFGILTGILSGFIGAGGGFIIVPILLRMGLNMKKAVGTSLLIIAIQSFVALSGDLFNEEIMAGGINWTSLFLITAVTIAGVITGSHFQKKFSVTSLRKIFGYLLFAVAVGLIIKLSV